MTFKPAHKVVGDVGKPGQTTNPLGFVIQPSEKTLAEYIERKTQHEAFNHVKNECKLTFDEWYQHRYAAILRMPYFGELKAAHFRKMGECWRVAQENK